MTQRGCYMYRPIRTPLVLSRGVQNDTVNMGHVHGHGVLFSDTRVHVRPVFTGVQSYTRVDWSSSIVFCLYYLS